MINEAYLIVRTFKVGLGKTAVMYLPKVTLYQNDTATAVIMIVQQYQLRVLELVGPSELNSQRLDCIALIPINTVRKLLYA